MPHEPTAMELRVAAVLGVEAGADWRQWVGTARACIRAMREPTEDMLDAGWCFSMTDGEQYRRMVIAASPDDPAP